MSINFDSILELIITSGIYIVIISKLFKSVKKTRKDKGFEAKEKQEYTNFETMDKVNKKTVDNQKMRQPHQVDYKTDKGMKKQSVFTSMMNQVDKISESFENIEKNWNKTQKKEPTMEKPYVKVEPKKSYSNKVTGIAKEKDPNSEIYTVKNQEKIYGLDNTLDINARRQELRKAIVLKEILDKPLAYRQTRR